MKFVAAAVISFLLVVVGLVVVGNTNYEKNSLIFF